MKYVEIIANNGSAHTIKAIAEKAKAHSSHFGAMDEGGMQQIRLVVPDHKLQWVLDALQTSLGAQPTASVVVLGVETSLTSSSDETNLTERTSNSTREYLLNELGKNSILDVNYLVLILLSTVVAGVGLIENNVAVIIGAMVIAPLLSPNLALSLGTALGDWELVKQSVRTLGVGILVSVSLSILLGMYWPSEFNSHELLVRTESNFASVFLALASGAAAALSLSSGMASVLVGVMVAVALLPPAATAGIYLGSGRVDLAGNAGLLLAINIVSVNLAAKVVFLLKGVSPRKTHDKLKARKATAVYVLGWIIILIGLMAIISLR